ncbi:hypothetical protein F975_02418 [Acinetobacter sp. ANC 3789]|uniref:DUF3987 domain-containing protein n=1 Tax=Acinetobacter sp. ANC 3789 TaxID=1217714 RepID=UPI0002CF9248|nr:DUF3987 domain-containing protein [Acinetobacter sp. ANC 3789]ENU79789.1 hypothetical protein F975_02418 [Acinetobacter sp. ANC 3789]
MNTQPTWDTTIPFDFNEHGTNEKAPQSDLVTLLEESTVTLLSSDPVKQAMVKIFGGCPPEIKKSVIDDFEGDNFFHHAVWDTYDYSLNLVGARFYDVEHNQENSSYACNGGNFFNCEKLKDSPLLVTEDSALAFITSYAVYHHHKITDKGLKQLSLEAKQIYFVCSTHELLNYKRRFRDTGVNIIALQIPCDITTNQSELDAEITGLIMGSQSSEWDTLIPIIQGNTAINAPYPIDSLPPLAKLAAMAISEHVQAPIAMTAQCVIGAMSHIAQSYVNAPDKHNPHGEPCSLFLLTEGQSGSRKTTSRKLADKAIIEHERKQYDLYRRDLEQWRSGQAGLNKKDREAYGVENPPPNDPSTLYSDITLESIAGLYVDGIIKNASISSDEAAQFFGGHTMKSDTRNHALGGYTKLFDDGTVERTRSKSNLNGSGRAYDVRLTFNLQGQHEVLSDALKDPVLKGQGFLPRFILTIPENLAGTRLQDTSHQSNNAHLDHRLVVYWTRCAYLLDDCPQPQTGHELHDGRFVMSMNEQAKQIDLSFYNEVERLQAKGQRYEYLQAFASRASQLARRLATVFAYFEGQQEIDATILSGACDIVRHSLGEWSRYAEIEVSEESNAQKLLKWLIKKCTEQQVDNIIYQVAQSRCNPKDLRRKDTFELAINELVATNHIQVTDNGKRVIRINPILLNGGK